MDRIPQERLLKILESLSKVAVNAQRSNDELRDEVMNGNRQILDRLNTLVAEQQTSRVEIRELISKLSQSITNEMRLSRVESVAWTERFYSLTAKMLMAAIILGLATFLRTQDQLDDWIFLTMVGAPIIFFFPEARRLFGNFRNGRG